MTNEINVNTLLGQVIVVPGWDDLPGSCTDCPFFRRPGEFCVVGGGGWDHSLADCQTCPANCPLKIVQTDGTASMNDTGIMRQIDDLGRVAIPKTALKECGIERESTVAIYTDKSNGIIIIRKGRV